MRWKETQKFIHWVGFITLDKDKEKIIEKVDSIMQSFENSDQSDYAYIWAHYRDEMKEELYKYFSSN